VGRSVDPAVSSTGSPYGYAGGGPVTGSDPTGLCGFWCKVTVGAVVVGVAACIIVEPCGAAVAGGAAALVGGGGSLALAGGGSLAVAGGATVAGETIVAGAAVGALGGATWAMAGSRGGSSSGGGSGGSSGETCSDGTIDHIWENHRFGGKYAQADQTENVFTEGITRDRLKQMINEAMEHGTEVPRSSSDLRAGYYKDYAFDDVEVGLRHQNGIRLVFDEFGNLKTAIPRFVY